MAKSSNKNLKQANKAKKDEFYTQLSDIERELGNYKEHLKGKVIFCNCDDPMESNFYFYFAQNFEFLGIKKLISTHYESEKKSYKLEIVADINKDGKIDKLDTIKTPLKQNGDFRSPECIEILKEADIIATNPPFSLFRDYVAQLIKYGKKFVIMGNVNAITYKEIFPLLKGNKVWFGHSIKSGDREFEVPKDYPLTGAGCRTDEDGNKYIRVKGVRWFTNLDYKERHEDLILHKTYNKEEYPKYENYDAINVDVTKNIPMDYTGEMGVPITFMDKYSPDQFEIIALGIVGSIEFSNNRKMEILDKKTGKPNGKTTFNAKGTLYRRYNPESDKKPPAFKDFETGELYSSIYARVIIKNKKL